MKFIATLEITQVFIVNILIKKINICIAVDYKNNG